MRFFHDQEFYENGKTIEPISIGVVAEDGKEYYAVFRDWMDSPAALADVRKHSWLMANVVPHLPDLARQIVMGEEPAPVSWQTHPVIKPRWRIALEVQQFIEQYGPDRDEHQLFTWYGAYDHVMLAQMYGPMIQLPPCIPMYTNDLKSLVAGMEREGVKVTLPTQPADVHHALIDARWNFAVWRALNDAAIDVMRAIAAPWSATEETVTIPRSAFIAGHERLTSQGPNEGYSSTEEEAAADALWRRLL